VLTRRWPLRWAFRCSSEMANPSELSLPDPETWSVKGVVAAYNGWLEVKAPDNRKAFLRRLKDDPEAGHAEAVTFNLLRMMQKNTSG